MPSFTRLVLAELAPFHRYYLSKEALINPWADGCWLKSSDRGVDLVKTVPIQPAAGTPSILFTSHRLWRRRDKHRITVAIKSITLLNGVSVSCQNLLPTTKGTHQHQQR